MTKDDEAEVVLTEASRGLVRLLIVCSKEMGLWKSIARAGSTVKK